VENLLWKGQINFNLPTSFILLIIDHIFVIVYSFLHIYIYIYVCVCVYIYYIFSTIICIFYRVSYISVKRKRSLSLRLIDNLYSLFHGFRYTGLMMAQKKRAKTSHLCNKLCCA
jgi:hypothetical protein